MEILALVLTIGLPLIKIIMFPARTMGRGGNWTLIGAAMIVGLMMALWFGMQTLTAPTGDAATATAKAGDTTPEQMPDFDHLPGLL